MQENNYFKLGLFVVGAFFLFFAGLICLGIMDQFKSKARLMTQVSESVQGLSRGSSVRFQGVPIGKVTDISIETGAKRVEITMEVNLSNFHSGVTTDFGGHPLAEQEFYARLDRDILENGLRCRIEAEGITGMKYIEFSYEKDPAPVRKDGFGFARHRNYYVPSEPSLLADLRTTFVSILNKIDSIDYKGVSDRVVVTLDSADRFLNDPRIKDILTNLNTASGSIVKTVNTLNSTVTEERVEKLLDDSEKTVRSIGDVSRRLDAELSRAEIGETTRKARTTLDSLRTTGDKLNQTMDRLDGGIDAAVELIQLLDRDPAALIRGKVRTTEPVRK